MGERRAGLMSYALWLRIGTYTVLSATQAPTDNLGSRWEAASDRHRAVGGAGLKSL